MICSECKDPFSYENYIDADDGQGERPICNDCYGYVVMKGLVSYERYTETNYWQSVGPHFGTACIGTDLDCPGCRASDTITGRFGPRALRLAERSNGFEANRSTSEFTLFANPEDFNLQSSGS